MFQNHPMGEKIIDFSKQSMPIFGKIKASNIYTNISKASELKEWFINNKILKQSSDKLEINNNYKNYFIIENYRGTQNIKYKKDILDLIAGNSIFGGRER